MHELGVVIEVVKTIDRIFIEQNLTKIEKIVLQIGELSAMIPAYIKECYPAAVDGTRFEETKLEIEVIPGTALCKDCNEKFNLIKQQGRCPNCNERNLDLLSGKEFNIKEIVAY